MGESNIKRLEGVLEKADFSKGFATTQELYKAGIKDVRELTSLCRAGVLVRYSRGVYKKAKPTSLTKCGLLPIKYPTVFLPKQLCYICIS